MAHNPPALTKVALATYNTTYAPLQRLASTAGLPQRPPSPPTHTTRAEGLLLLAVWGWMVLAMDVGSTKALLGAQAVCGSGVCRTKALPWSSLCGVVGVSPTNAPW